MSYDGYKAAEYAHKWAYKRNPNYYDFSKLGGDCTNFISQSIHAGGALMNYKKNGWYYNSSNDRAPSWTGVEFLCDFLISNKGIGPYAEEVDIKKIKIGDIVQLSFIQNKFSHSLIVVKAGEINNLNNVLVATHTDDSDNRPLSSYQVLSYRFLKIAARNI